MIEKECVIHKDKVCHDEFEDRRIECQRVRELQESLIFWMNRIRCDNLSDVIVEEEQS